MTTDEEITGQMVRNPEKGFRLLMAKYHQKVYWHVRRMVVSHAEAQDITQEVFIRVFRAFARHRDNASLAAWIYSIANNETLRSIERNARRRLPLEPVCDRLNTMASDGYVDFAKAEAVSMQKAILRLPPRQQMVFNMRYYDDMAYDDIAMAAGTTVESARANYHLAKERVARYLADNQTV